MTHWITTTQILSDLQQKKETAWEQFCRIFSPVVEAFARQMGLRPSEAEDAAQETLMAFCQAVQAGRYDRQQGQLSSWLFGFARRIVLKTQRQQGRHLGQSASPESLEKLSNDPTIHLTWETQWQRIVLGRCLERVRQESDAKVFAAFTQYALQDRSADEVARQLGISRNAVYIAKHRILSRLRELEGQLQEFELESTT